MDLCNHFDFFFLFSSAFYVKIATTGTVCHTEYCCTALEYNDINGHVGFCSWFSFVSWKR